MARADALEEAYAKAYMADRVAVIDHGRIVAVDTPTKLMDHHGSGTVVRFLTDRPVPEADLLTLPGVAGAKSHANGHTTHTLDVTAADMTVPALFEWAARSGRSVADLSIRRPTLEDVFLNLTGHRLRD